jgi:glutamate carboxypeptidase
MVEAMRCSTLAVLVGCATGVAQAQSPESRIAAWAGAHVEEAVSLLERLVNVNSGTMNHEGVREVGRLLRTELEALGFEARWIELPDSVNRAGHLFAERGGPDGRGRRVLLIGHLDTVYERDSPFQRFQRSGRRATGPGVADMKGGDVVMLFALKALHAAGLLEGSRVIVALTGDEESAGQPVSVSRRELIEAARRSDVALEFEGAVRDSGGEYATIERRGSSGWFLVSRGRSGHSSGIFGSSQGFGAIYEAARVLSAFREELRGEPGATFSPGVMVGGTDVEYARGRGTAAGKGNIIAQTAAVEGDLRTTSAAQLERVRQRMRSIAARSLPGTESEIRFWDAYPAMEATPGNQRLLALLNEVNRDLGLPPMRALPPERRGASDVSFVAPIIPALGGLGAYGGGAHAPGESIDLSLLERQITRAALLIYRLTRCTGDPCSPRSS